MNNNDYNNYMLNLYKDVSLKSESLPDQLLNHLFQNLASTFNRNIANEYLQTLHRKNYNLLQKTEIYPYMFWKTSEATPQINMGLEKLQEQYKKKLEEVITTVYPPSRKSSYHSEEERLQTVNQLINGELGNYGDTFGSGIFKEFSKDMFTLYSLLGDKVQVVEQIKLFYSTANKNFTEVSLPVDFSEFPTYLKKIFNKTPIIKDINNINFEELFELSELKTPKLKV